MSLCTLDRVYSESKANTGWVSPAQLLLPNTLLRLSHSSSQGEDWICLWWETERVPSYFPLMDRGVKMSCPLWKLADYWSFPQHLALTNISVCFYSHMFYMEKRSGNILHSKMIGTLQIWILFTFFVIVCLQNDHQQSLPSVNVHATPPSCVGVCSSS